MLVDYSNGSIEIGRVVMNVNNFKVWPHLTIVAVVCAIVAGVAVGWWVRHEQTTSAATLQSAARIQRVDGDVALNNSEASDTTNDNWVQATANQPFTVGDRIYTRENAHASLAFTGRNFARLNPNTSLDVLSLADRRTQLALRDGSAMFDVGYLSPGELFEVATPYGAVDFQQPGLYDVGFDNGNVVVSVLSGLAQVVGLGGSGQIGKGEMLRLLGQTAADVVLSRLNNNDAGYLVDDYYGNQYPQYYDGRYSDYNAYLNDPYYFDPYRRTTSYQYASSYIPGISDLDYYGNWQNVDGYGYAWSPRVDTGWAPYQDGYWMNDYPYGPTWVSNEPWGYAPYHYGRWTNVGNQWYWIPDQINTTPTYSPALVAFVPFAQDQIGWVPLGPGDPYAPRYYNNDWSPHYLSRTDVVQQRVANLYVPNAVTVVPYGDFERDVDWRRVRRADRQMLGSVNPVLDPLTLTPLRNAVVHSAWGRGKKDLPPGIAKKLQDTTVVTSTAPIEPPFRRNLARNLRVESVKESFGNKQFKVKDERGSKSNEQMVQAPSQVRERGNGRFNSGVGVGEPSRGNGRDKQEQRRIDNAQNEGNRQAQFERERQSQVERARQEQNNRNRQAQVDQVRRAQIERAAQEQNNRNRQAQVERARQQQAERSRAAMRQQQQQQPQGERVGNRGRQQAPAVARPEAPPVVRSREQQSQPKSRPMIPRTQAPVEVRQSNPGRGRPEMKNEQRSQGRPSAPNPNAGGPGNGKGKGKKP